MSIEVRSVTKLYGQQKAVDNISFMASQGEIVGFLGPNGAGKSTTMKIITGYLAADAGNVAVCGMDVRSRPLETKKRIGYLPESNPLYYDMYVREYLDFIAGIHGVNEKKEKIAAVIDTVGLKPESKKKIGQLSKGYKQRVGLAAALVHDPEVLILDEPTTGLDPNQIIEIREVIKTLGQHKTVLFSSHILQEVEAICDRVIIISKGRLVADDTLSGLRNHAREKQMIQVAFKENIDAALLQELPGVQQVNHPQNNEWELICTGIPEVKRALLEMALHHQLNIVSLQTAEHSLEEVFRNLTQPGTATAVAVS